jgi:CheY-like chemotaxis protein
MKKHYIYSLLIIFLCSIVFFNTKAEARDFIVEFIEENYNETDGDFSNDPIIYHSIQVNSIAGPKILILTGNDSNYRAWLRYYIADNKKLITKIADENADEFISSKAFSIDITSIHPLNGNKWNTKGEKDSDQVVLTGENNILIVDSNEKRTELIQTVLQNMGYVATIFMNGAHALNSFKLQPEKFKMVIVNHDITGMSSMDFVEQMLKINHVVPVVIDTGYKNTKVKTKFMEKFSGSGSVHLKSVVLKELKKTVEKIINKKA